MKKVVIGTALLISMIWVKATPPVEIDITRYGAVGDGKTLNTTAIQKAIDDCRRQGGGKVVFPAGIWLSGTIVLKDSVTLQPLKSNQGAIKMGTESMAPFENIFISDCYIYDTKNGGIKLLTVDGAHLRNVAISNITMVDVRTPMLIRLGSRLSVFRKGKDIQQPTGTLENVVIKNVKAQASANAQLKPPSGILITGVPGHYITNLTLENIDINLAGGGTVEQGRQQVPEAVDKYPEVKTFGPLVPAYGVWARHVKGLKLLNITLHLDSNDRRPAFICEDGKDIEVAGWKIPETSGAPSIIRLQDVEKARIRKMEVKGNAGVFVGVEGKNSKDIQVGKNNTPGIPKKLNRQ